MIFFDEEEDDGDSDPSEHIPAWRYAASNGSVLAILVVLTIAGILTLLALLVFARPIVGWTLVVFDAVRKAL